MQLAPVVRRGPQYSDEERAVIAGYLLQQRRGTLQALSSSSREMEIDTEFGRYNQLRYYQICEAYSRFLLYWIGYEVNKGQMYGQPETMPR